MNNTISDKIRLLGLIVKTIPFTYSDNIINCKYNCFIEIDELIQLKLSLENELNNMNLDDIGKQSLNDDVYFLNSTIIDLQKQNGNNI
jgi:hypothetical protein